MSAPNPTFTEWDFIADMLYQQDAIDEGYAAGVRWWCHRPDGDGGRDHWRKKAEAAVREWADRERETMAEQNAKHGHQPE